MHGLTRKLRYTQAKRKRPTSAKRKMRLGERTVARGIAPIAKTEHIEENGRRNPRPTVQADADGFTGLLPKISVSVLVFDK